MDVFHDKPQSLWMQTAEKAVSYPQANGDLSADVIVVGAGFTGLRAALRLAQAGVDCVVLEAQDIGFGASGRNGGQVNPILPFNSPEKLRERVGPVFFERMAQASIGSADALFSFVEQHDIDCAPRQNGWLRVDHFSGAKEKSRAIAKSWTEHGAKMQLLEGHALKQLTGSEAYQTGILTPKGGAVQPLALVRGIARVVTQSGGRIFTRSPVTKLDRDGKVWRAHTANGSVRAETVIVATNGYTDGLLNNLKKSIFPIASVQIATIANDDEAVSSVLPGGQTIADTRRVIMYARREADNRVVFGGHGKLTRDGRLLGADWLKRDAERIFPQLKRSRWEFAWGGKIAVTDDRMPHLHEPAPGLHVGLGYNGRGVAMANVMGTVLADRALGERQENLTFPTSPVKPIPFRQIQLLGTGTAIRLLQMLDRRESTKGWT